jgi:ribonuclease R
MPEVFEKNILRLLKHADYRPAKLGHLAKALGVSSEDYPQFKLAFEQLRQSGRVVLGARSLVSLPPISGRVIGTFRANPRGFGFVAALEANSHGDLFVPARFTAGAMTGDIVSAKVVKTGRMRLSGKVVEILERGQSRFVGTLMKGPDGWVVQPDGNGFSEPISVDDVTAKGADRQDKVVVEIVTWPSEKYLARGVIVELLGKAGRYESEIKSIIRQFHLPTDFDGQCIEQARGAAAAFDDHRLDGREEITDKVIITIDPPDAKDFDDAISLEKDGDGNFVLGVHIADVSSFIATDSPLDLEARQRGNSAYLPGRTIPMLPEILSNGICSLQAGQKRFCKSAFLTYDAKAEVLARRFSNSVICSSQRLTYQKAEKVLKGHTKGVKDDVIKLLKDMESLSRLIEHRREKNGMLHLDLPETELIMDKSGRVVDARPADASYPHTIIEMFMVEANEAVASLIDRIKLDFMRRIHPEPDSLSLKNLSKLISAFGVKMPRKPDRRAIQDVLAAVKGTEYSMAVNMMVLRSFEKAQYSPLDIGHFALASRQYCHFTSPIRRYADLLVHRVLQSYLARAGGSPTDWEMPAREQLEEIGRHITFTEQRAEDAERQLKTVLILQMLNKHIGENLDCIVSGLAGFGVFVQCRKFGIEGLIAINELGDDEWKYSASRQVVFGRRSGFVIRLGQQIKVRIVSVNIPARQLNVIPAEPLVSPPKKKSKKKNSGRLRTVKKRRSRTKS